MCVHEESRCHSDHNNSTDINSTRQSADHRVLFISQLNRHLVIQRIFKKPCRIKTENLFETRAWKWYNLYKVRQVRAKTLASYEGYLKKYLLPYFGPRDICIITIDDVQEFMNSKAAYSKKSIEELRLTLGMILNVAKEDGLINITPAKSKRLRNPSSKKSVREAPTSDEADDIESHLQDIPQSRDRRYVAMLLKSPRLI